MNKIFGCSALAKLNVGNKMSIKAQAFVTFIILSNTTVFKINMFFRPKI
jgi:hypothetical protein